MKPVSVEIALAHGETHRVPWGETRQSGTLTITMKEKGKGTEKQYTLSLASEAGIQLEYCQVIFNYNYTANHRMLGNGFQSWSETREYAPGERQMPLRFPLLTRNYYNLHMHGEEHFHKPQGVRGLIHSHMYTYITGDGPFVFLGSLAPETWIVFYHHTKDGHLVARNLCQGQVVKKQCVMLDILVVEDDATGAFSTYGKKTGGRSTAQPVTGWTSWYNYYTDISEQVLIENIRGIQDNRYPLDYFQIDDGYQIAVGDWLSTKDSFPRGMKHLADQIHSAGMKAGLWLAPFACAGNSQVRRDHPDWLITGSDGKPVKAGFVPLWGGDYFALDIYHPGVVSWLERVFSTVLDVWGYDMVKLDFLFAAALLPREGKSRAMIMHDGMKLLRRLCGDKIILGCGVPLAQTPGNVDYCRIGSDVHLAWEDPLLKFIRYPERVSTINSLQSTVYRHQLNATLFGNDPDVVILREENNRLTRIEKRTLFAINALLGNLVFTSDNVSLYGKGSRELFSSLFPHREKIINSVTVDSKGFRIDFTLAGLNYICYTNLYGATPWEIPVVQPLYINSLTDLDEGIIEEGTTIMLKPRQTMIGHVLPPSTSRPTIAGSTGHIFPGSDIKKLKVKGKKIDVIPWDNLPGDRSFIIQVPEEGSWTINGIGIETERVKGLLLCRV